MGANNGFFFGLLPGLLKQQMDAQSDASKFAITAQGAAQDKLYAEAKNNTDASKINADNTAARDAARLKQRNAAAAATGRQDTILTGPLGVPSTPQTGGKTLLGT